MTSCSNAMLNYQFYSKLKLLRDGNFIHFNLSALGPWGTPTYSKVLSGDKLFDPTTVFVMGVEFVWQDTSLNVCAL